MNHSSSNCPKYVRQTNICPIKNGLKKEKLLFKPTSVMHKISQVCREYACKLFCMGVVSLIKLSLTSVHLVLIVNKHHLQGGSSKVTGKVHAMAFDPSGHILWAGDDRGSIFSFTVDVATGKLTKTHRYQPGVWWGYLSLTFMPWGVVFPEVGFQLVSSVNLLLHSLLIGIYTWSLL